MGGEEKSCELMGSSETIGEKKIMAADRVEGEGSERVGKHRKVREHRV